MGKFLVCQAISNNLDAFTPFEAWLDCEKHKAFFRKAKSLCKLCQEKMPRKFYELTLLCEVLTVTVEGASGHDRSDFLSNGWMLTDATLPHERADTSEMDMELRCDPGGFYVVFGVSEEEGVFRTEHLSWDEAGV